MEDLGKNITEADYKENIYLSINAVGTRVFKDCAYFEADGYTFIWTREENFILNKQDLGDYVIIPYNFQTKVTLKKVT